MVWMSSGFAKSRIALSSSLSLRTFVLPFLPPRINKVASLPSCANNASRRRTVGSSKTCYLPFKQKRESPADAARKQGLEGLASRLEAQNPEDQDVKALAADHLNEKAGIKTAADALRGAREILAQSWSEDIAVRGGLRRLLRQRARLVVHNGQSRRTAAKGKYKNLQGYQARCNKVTWRQMMALRRAVQDIGLRFGNHTAYKQDCLVSPGNESYQWFTAGATPARRGSGTGVRSVYCTYVCQGVAPGSQRALRSRSGRSLSEKPPQDPDDSSRWTDWHRWTRNRASRRLARCCDQR